MSRAYYNEFDPFAAAWLRELIKAGLVADGDVDERSIDELRSVGWDRLIALKFSERQELFPVPSLLRKSLKEWIETRLVEERERLVQRMLDIECPPGTKADRVRLENVSQH